MGADLSWGAMSRRNVAIGDLQFGMYVAELDRPWTDTPFMFQGFYLRTTQQLEALRKFCKHVFVDVARSEPAVAGRPASPAARASGPAFKIRGTAQYAEQENLEAEIRRCSAIHASSVTALMGFFGSLEKGTVVPDGHDVQNSVMDLADSVVRNPDALLLLSKIRGKTAATHARALQVSVYMMVFARFLQLEHDEIELLGLLGMLQDIGKTRLPTTLLEKPGPLTAAESEMVKKHVELSAHILGATASLPPKLAALALLHHERQDGAGYPRGLKAYQIGLYGSIAAICDTYDALMTLRPYADESSPSAAVKVLLAERGTGFHAQLVDEFIQCVGAFPVGSVVELNSGEIGVVVAENRTERLKPKVMIVQDERGKPVRHGSIVDLSRESQTPKEAYRVRRTLPHSKLNFDPRKFFL